MAQTERRNQLGSGQGSRFIEFLTLGGLINLNGGRAWVSSEGSRLVEGPEEWSPMGSVYWAQLSGSGSRRG